MDRSKLSSTSRGSKKLAQQPPETFIALGAKSSGGRDDGKRSSSLSKPPLIQPSTSKDRKREASVPSLQLIPPQKKLKVGLPGRSASVSSGSSSDVRIGQQPTGIDPWEALAVDCDPTDLFDNIISCINSGNADKAIPLILGALRTIRLQRFKPCKVLYNSVLLSCQCNPILFTNEHVVSALVSALKKDVGAGFKNTNKGNIYNQILFVNLLVHAFNDVPQWPDLFVKLYVEDALGERTWIDNPYCKPFVDNIVTAFNTKQPPKLLLVSEIWSGPSRDTSSPLTINIPDDEETNNEHKTLVDNWKVKVFPRYVQVQELVEKISLEAIQEQVARRQQPEAITKNFVRFLSTACGLVEIRMLAVSRLETWLHNHKLMKPAQELLAYVCYNCSARTQRDIEVVAQLSKLRLKSKPLVNIFNNCLKEMVLAFPENLYPLLKYTIYNELSNARNTNNLVVVGAIFQVSPEASADAFADICLELLLNKDDYLRSLRALLKEINRVLRHDFNLLTIAHSLVRERQELLTMIREFESKDRMFFALADLTCMCIFLGITPQVRDAATQSKRDVNVLQTFQTQVSNIQREAVTWLHDSAVRVYRPSPQDFIHILHKVLFLVPAEEYYKIDSWPGENERNVFLRLASEVPLLQTTLLRILLIGLSKEHPIGQNDVMEILDQLIKRAANLNTEGLHPLMMDKIEIVDFFFNLCSYSYPENIILPSDYIPPNLAIASLYWKTWLMLLILAAHNPTTFGSLAWNKYPTLRTLMEMCITNHFSFPPPTMTNTEDTVESFASKELQVVALEKQKILEFETHLAAASTKAEITEQTSLLLSQLMELKPQGDARKPPQAVLDQLQTLNTSHRLGHLLCRSRNPDFLLDIMSRQGGTAHMPWLAELVQNSEGAFAHLPVQCLCEYLLSTIANEKSTKQLQLLAHLRAVVNGSDPLNTCEVLDYLLRRLTSIHAASRVQAVKGLTLILSPSDDLEVNHVDVTSTHWLTHYMPVFPHLKAVRPSLIQFLRQALFVETNPVHVSNYVQYLATLDLTEAMPDLLELVLDMASLIVERSSITSNILPGEQMQTIKDVITIFCVYLQHARQPTDETFHWCESQDQVAVTWANGEECTLQILIVHASIILLTYGPVEGFAYFETLMETWFPTYEEHPKAYLVDTSEEALLVPDWLKLRMIRSNVPRLVDAAIDKLEAPQLVLFIQSFGIPVVSISKLLCALDRATAFDAKLVVDSVLDKNYMIQLVEVQNRRGATGGEIFVAALDLQAPNLQDEEGGSVVEGKKELMIAAAVKSADSIDVNNINGVLNAFFTGVATNEIFHQLIKVLSTNANVRTLTFAYFKTITPDLVANLIRELKYTATLFKILFVKRNLSSETIATATFLLNIIGDQNITLSSILKKFLCDASMDVAKEEDKSKMNAMDIIRDASVVGSKQLQLTGENLESLSEKLGNLLLNGDVPAEKTGLIIDWLNSINLEVTHSTKGSIQMDLLFAQRDLPFRPLLISSLLQRGSWSTLSNIVQYLLEEKHTGYCPKSVLDFLTALTQSPKLWQGRDKAIPKHHHSEDVLHLNCQQVLVLTSYILEEAKQNENPGKRMEIRLHLLLKTISSNLNDVAKFLLQEDDANNRELLLLLYMSRPSIGKYWTDFGGNDFVQSIYRKTSSSIVDIISHTLLSALASTSRMKDWNKKSQELELCARKLSSAHPELVLRQLPMLAGSLRGRAQYEFPVLRNRGHLQLFGQVLGILELLQPSVFSQSDSLFAVMESYFLLLEYHGHSKDLTTLVGRLVVFLQNWITRNVRDSLKYLQQYGPLLNALQDAQPSVRPLLSSVSLPTQGQHAPSELLVGAATSPAPEPLPTQWPLILNGLQSPDPVAALQELEYLSYKKPQLLQHVSQHLYDGLSSVNGSVRNFCVILTLRLLKHNPKENSIALPTVLSCMNSDNPDVVTAILDKLPEFTTIMQEHAKVILVKAFSLGVNANVNASNSIAKTIAMLSLQFNC